MCCRIFFSLVLFLVLLQVSPLVKGARFRIISGIKVTTLQFPYLTRLESFGQHRCGGSIIHKNFVLTAAHCVKLFDFLSSIPPHVLQVRVGSDVALTGGQIYEVNKIIPHENYKEKQPMDQYDIALLRISKPFEFSDRVQIIDLVTELPADGETAWVAGYGLQEARRNSESQKRHLMAVEIPIVSLENCRGRLQNVADDMICAGNQTGHRDSCSGDSGGPLTVNNKLAGIVAWGIGCGREGLPGVYTSVYFYKNWINSQLASNGKDQTPRSTS